MRRHAHMPEDRAAAASGGVARFTGWLQRHLPKIVVAPSFLAALVFFYGFIIWTAYISLTGSRMLADYEIEGFDNYVNIWRLTRWHTAVENLAIFGILFIGMSMVVGCILAVLLDQRIRAEGALRTIYLYPMAISYIVTGTAWRWLMDPGIGIEAAVRNLGWESFSFDWITNRDMTME